MSIFQTVFNSSTLVSVSVGYVSIYIRHKFGIQFCFVMNLGFAKIANMVKLIATDKEISVTLTYSSWKEIILVTCVMVWGGISYGLRSQLVVVRGYLTRQRYLMNSWDKLLHSLPPILILGYFNKTTIDITSLHSGRQYWSATMSSFFPGPVSW